MYFIDINHLNCRGLLLSKLCVFKARDQTQVVNEIYQRTNGSEETRV
jgi:hypothetical protein